MKSIRIHRLTPEEFVPFGMIIAPAPYMPDRVPGAFDWYGELADLNGIENATINLMTVYSREVLIQRFECHRRTREAVIPLGGRGVVIPLAPPGEFLPNKVAAFYVPGEKAVVLHPGTWHYVPYTLEDSASFLTVYRRDTSKDDVYYAELEESATLMH